MRAASASPLGSLHPAGRRPDAGEGEGGPDAGLAGAHTCAAAALQDGVRGSGAAIPLSSGAARQRGEGPRRAWSASVADTAWLSVLRRAGTLRPCGPQGDLV